MRGIDTPYAVRTFVFIASNGPTMDFKEICAVFQGTIFYDDLHGDLQSIAQELDRRHSQTPLVSLDGAASLLLARAVWNLFVGDLEAAHQHLSCLIEGEVYGRRWAFRAHAYSALVHTWREYPRLFKACDFGSGPTMVTWRSRRGADFARDALAWCKAHNNQEIPMLDTVEFRVIEEVCRVDHLVRWRARRLNPAAEDYADHAGQRAANARIVSASKRNLRGLRVLMVQLGLPSVSAYLSRALYELCHMEGDAAAHLHLEKMKSTYAEMGDEAGVGLYWLLRGDHNLSPPFTSPLVLNFDIVDAPDEFGGDSSVFHVTEPYPLDVSPGRGRRRSSSGEQTTAPRSTWRRIAGRLKVARSRITTALRTSLKDARGRRSKNYRPKTPAEIRYVERLRTARRCYAQAEVHFSQTNGTRGLAAAMLRKACSFVMEDMQVARFWAHPTYDGEIASLLDGSRELCQLSGDAQLEKVVDTHRLLHKGTGNGDLRSVGRRLGYGSEQLSNEVLGLCLALLGLRSSFYYRYHLGSFPRSRLASEVSRQIIKSMTIFRTVWYQVMLAQISLMKSVGLLGSVVWAEHLKDQWHSISNDCFSPAEDGDSHRNTHSEHAFTFFQHYLKITVAGILAVDSQVGEPDDFPGTPTLEMLELIRQTYPEDELTTRWIELQEIRIKYYKAQISHQRHVQMGEAANANQSLRSFLEDRQVLGNDHLQTRAWIIQVAAELGEDALAEETLSSMDDTETIPRLYPYIGRGTAAEFKRYDDRRALKSLEIILVCCVRLSLWSRASRLLAMLEEASPGYCTSVSSYTKLWPWQRCLYAGLVRENEGRYRLAFRYFCQAFCFFRHAQNCLRDHETRSVSDMPDVARLMEALTRRSIRWARDLPGVTKLRPTTDSRIDTRIFHIFGITMDYGNSDHNNEALLFLEAGRAQLVSDMSPEAAAAHYKYQAWLHLRTKQRRTAAEEQELQDLDAELDRVSFTLERTPDAGGDSAGLLLSGHKLRELYEAIPPTAIVVYTALSEDGLTVFAIDRTGLKVAYSVPDATPAVLKTMVTTFWDMVVNSRDRAENEAAVLELLGNGLSRLLIPVPVERCIAAREHVIFVPSGPFARLPFGALTYNGNYLLLQKQVSRVPSLSALRALQLRYRRRATTTADPATVRIIARPGGVRDQLRTGHRPLSFAGIEAKMIAHMTGSTALDANTVTRADFQRYLSEATILHLGTHGYSDAAFPFNSSLLLGSRFRVLDMLAVRGATQVALVVFSACLSGLPGRPSAALGDVDGFAHAVLAAGANAYLGALWKVDDLATMVHMWLFYAVLLMALDEPSLAEAWHVATRMLYELEVEGKIRILESFVACWDVWEARGEDPGGFVERGKRKLEAALVRLREEDDRGGMFDFKRPFVWAAFALVGDGSMRIRSSLHGSVMEMIRERRQAARGGQ